MKLKVVLFASLLTLGACIEKDIYEDQYVIDEKFMMQESYSVPLQSGKVSVVTLNEDTLAITDIALTIQIPVGAVRTRATDNVVNVSYLDYASLPEFQRGSSISVGNHTLWFEDSRKADYDYNDVVLHVRSEETKNESGNIDQMNVFTIRVKGIALGSGKRIGFGFTDVNDVDFDLTDDVRRDYFANHTGFINAESGKAFVACIPPGDIDDEDMGAYSIRHRGVYGASKMGVGYVEYHPIRTTYTKTDNGRVRFRYYIKVENGQKLYVGEYNKNLEGALPYGIRMEPLQNYYPLERVGIQQAFPEFANWVKTGQPIDWNASEKANAANCYQITDRKIWSW